MAIAPSLDASTILFRWLYGLSFPPLAHMVLRRIGDEIRFGLIVGVGPADETYRHVIVRNSSRRSLFPDHFVVCVYFRSMGLDILILPPRIFLVAFQFVVGDGEDQCSGSAIFRIGFIFVAVLEVLVGPFDPHSGSGVVDRAEPSREAEGSLSSAT